MTDNARQIIARGCTATDVYNLALAGEVSLVLLDRRTLCHRRYGERCYAVDGNPAHVIILARVHAARLPKVSV